MPTKICKICGEKKDATEGFFGSSGLVCRTCKTQKDTERKRVVGGKVVMLLEEILAMQHRLEERIDELEDKLSNEMSSTDEELQKIRRKLKKMSVK